jgi:hypothetical protein
MSETTAIALYREITGASEAQAKNAYMFMEIRRQSSEKSVIPFENGSNDTEQLSNPAEQPPLPQKGKGGRAQSTKK